MSYTMYDANGYVGDVASNQGMEDFMAYLEATKDDQFASLVEDGAVEVTDEFLKALEALKPPADEGVATTLTGFKELAKKAEGIIIVTDGVFVGDAGGSDTE